MKQAHKVKHRKTSYLGIEVIENGETKIIPPKKRLKNFGITKSVRYGDISIIYHLFREYKIIELLDELIPRRGLPVGDVFASLATNHIIDRETLNMFSKLDQADISGEQIRRILTRV